MVYLFATNHQSPTTHNHSDKVQMSVNVTLSANRYGKDKVRVFRVIRPSTPGGKQIVLEYNVRLMIEGDFETR
jgi:hypothetical protein